MTVKEFAQTCMADDLSADVKKLINGELRLILGVNRLEDLKDLQVANREIDVFTIRRKADGSLNWLIVIKE